MNVDIKIEGNSSQETHIVTQNQESILRVAAVVNSAIVIILLNKEDQ